MTTSPRPVGAAVTIAAVLAIAWFTLRPGEPGPPPASGGEYLLTDLVLNILLFLPLGIGLALSGGRVRGTIAIGTLASIAIELTQRWWIPNRTSSLHDVVTNGLGTALGAMLVATWGERARWRRIAGVPLAIAVVTVWMIGGLLVIPILPRGGIWYGFWGHEFFGTTLFPGRILSLSADGIAVPDGRFFGAGVLRERVARSDTFRLATTIVTGGPFEGRAQLVAISGGGDELASLWQTGTSVLARQRLRLSDLSMRTLWLRMDNALPPTPGDTIPIVFEATRRGLELRVGQGETAKTSRVRLGPELFWTGFLPFEFEARAQTMWWPFVGAALIFLAVGILLAPERVAAIAALALTLVAGPLIERTAFPSPETMLAAVGGIGAGWWLSRRLGLAASNQTTEQLFSASEPAKS